MTESRFADEDTLAHIAQIEAENAKLREELAAVLEAQEKQEPFPFSAKRVTYHKAAPVVQPDTVLVPREPTEEMLIAGCKELGALYGHHGAKEAYCAMIAAYEGQP